MCTGAEETNKNPLDERGNKFVVEEAFSAVESKNDPKIKVSVASNINQPKTRVDIFQISAVP